MVLVEREYLRTSRGYDSLLTRCTAVKRMKSNGPGFNSSGPSEGSRSGAPARAWAAAILAIYFFLPGLVAGPSFAQADGETKHRIVRVYYSDFATGKRILISFEASLLETNEVAGYHVLDASDTTISRLQAAGLRVEEDLFYQPRMARLPDFPCYATVEETFASAAAIASTNPNLADWTDIGDSWEKSAGLGGYDIMALVLTNKTIAGDKPKLLLTCAIHAREYATAQLCLDFAHYLVDGYGSDADATWILNDHEVHIVLQANPDGRKQAEIGQFWRKNTNQNYCAPTSSSRGADLNRNFPFAWNCCGGSSGFGCDPTFRGSSPTSEPEVASVVDYGRMIFPDQRGPGANDAAPADASGVFFDVHAYGELILWPYGFTASPAPNGNAMQTLGRKLAFGNSYWPEQAIGLYPTDGTTDDFFYGELGVASIAFELGTEFFQACSVYENTIKPANLPVLIYGAKVARTPYLTPAGPDVIGLLLSPSTVMVGDDVSLSFDVDDDRFSSANGLEPTQIITGAEYYIDVPPWSGGQGTALAASDGSFDSVMETAVGQIETAGLSAGRHLLFVRGLDAGGQWGAMSAAFLTVEDPAMVPALSEDARWVAILLMAAAGFVLARWSHGVGSGRHASA
ncbi:MAG: M14 family zinc carboxypeptidase [Myxococcota bacterium]|nr:M14 family zinc carboxypeptidase [Myxococcota bacterium]